MIRLRKYAVLLSPLIGFGIGFAGGIFAIAFLRLIGRVPSPLQENILLFGFGIGGLALALVELIERIRFYRRRQLNGQNSDTESK